VAVGVELEPEDELDILSLRRLGEVEREALRDDELRRHHHDDEEHQHDVDERRDVDPGDHPVIVALVAAHRHQEASSSSLSLSLERSCSFAGFLALPFFAGASLACALRSGISGPSGSPSAFRWASRILVSTSVLANVDLIVRWK